MTGGELVVGKAALKAAEKVLAVDASQNKQLQKLAEGSPEMQRAAEQYAKRIAVKQTILLKIFEPLGRLVGISKSYFECDFADDMAEKIANIPDEDLVSPAPSVAVPAMQGLGYSLDEPDLKEMYLNLLATAADGRKSGAAHPSFADVIKQLSAPEAKHLTTVFSAPDDLPIVRVKLQRPGAPGWNTMVPVLADLRDAETGQPLIVDQNVTMWLDNWVRLGLIAIDFSVYVTDADAYDWPSTRPEFLHLKASFPEDHSLDFDRGVMLRTAFGSRFMQAVVSA